MFTLIRDVYSSIQELFYVLPIYYFDGYVSRKRFDDDAELSTCIIFIQIVFQGESGYYIMSGKTQYYIVVWHHFTLRYTILLLMNK